MTEEQRRYFRDPIKAEQLVQQAQEAAFRRVSSLAKSKGYQLRQATGFCICTKETPDSGPNLYESSRLSDIVAWLDAQP